MDLLLYPFCFLEGFSETFFPPNPDGFGLNYNDVRSFWIVLNLDLALTTNI